MSKVFCISAGQMTLKKKNHLFSHKHRYLNYGLLKIASILDDSSYKPVVVHGLFDSPHNIYTLCNELGLHNERTPILLSIPSFSALEWAKEFVVLLKHYCPDKKIIVGGRWVVGECNKWLKNHLNIDLVIPGVVGYEIIDLVKSHDPTKSTNDFAKIASRSLTEIQINYEHLYERHLFQPSIEVSSGCGMGCFFCEEKNIPLSKLKPVSLVASEMKNLETNDRNVEISPYLESSMFIATEKWATDLIEARELVEVSSFWRVETRVDKLKPKNIPSLARAGLKVIDLGLESASPMQLERMKKTNNPQKYLESARDLIMTAYDNNMWVKVNILLYSGETYETINETLSWLEPLKGYIKGVSVGPVIIFGIEQYARNYINELESYNSKPVNSGIEGVTYLDLSSEINHEQSIELSQEISREFMSWKDYFALKSFSYFSRDYKCHDFLYDLKGVSQNEVSFKI